MLLPDGPGAHVAYVAAERAGLIVVGIGPRAGLTEVRHLLDRTQASALLAPASHRGADLAELCETFPERLVVQDALPRSSGGKVAKQALREDIRRRLAEDDT